MREFRSLNSEGDVVRLFDTGPAQRLLDAHAQLQYPHRITFGEALLDIEDGAFCPTLTNTSPFLLDYLSVAPGMRVLDVFSGSGAFAIVAALRGADVTAIDLSPVAVACTRRNAVLNGVQVNAIEGTLAIAQQQAGFDLVIANPPLLPGTPTTLLEAALFDPDYRGTLEFLESLPGLLAPDGHGLLLLSDVFGRSGLVLDELVLPLGMAATILGEKNVGYETYRVHRLRHAPSNGWNP